MPNPFAYAELHSQNPDAAQAFYRQLLDWRVTQSETPNGVYIERSIPARASRAA